MRRVRSAAALTLFLAQVAGCGDSPTKTIDQAESRPPACGGPFLPHEMSSRQGVEPGFSIRVETNAAAASTAGFLDTVVVSWDVAKAVGAKCVFVETNGPSGVGGYPGDGELRFATQGAPGERCFDVYLVFDDGKSNVNTLCTSVRFPVGPRPTD